MRDIKFRAFQDNQMLTQPMAGVYAAKRFFGFLYEDIELMQFTGLKDKNGKEVYESDIVYWPHLDQWGVVYYNEEEVHFYSKPFQTDPDDTESYLDSTHMEVKGNIHENPELL